MAKADKHHDEPFPESTLDKLALFESHARAWFGVFSKQEKIERLQVFDLICGAGCDVNGLPGSPLRFLKAASEATFAERVIPRVSFYFNDKKREKISRLEVLVDEQYPDLKDKVKFSSKDFMEVFDEMKPLMSAPRVANLIFIDQFGIKFLTGEVLEWLTTLKCTDTLVFVTSSYVRRFGEQPEFQRHVAQEVVERVKSGGHKQSHESLVDGLSLQLPTDRYLIPFSIRKESKSNICGIVFASGSPFGAYKFLENAWRLFGGIANYSVDGDTFSEAQFELFEEHSKPKRIALFHQLLRDLVVGGELRTASDVFECTIRCGFLPRHANEVFKTMLAARELREKFSINDKSWRDSSVIPFAF